MIKLIERLQSCSQSTQHSSTSKSIPQLLHTWYPFKPYLFSTSITIQFNPSVPNPPRFLSSTKPSHRKVPHSSSFTRAFVKAAPGRDTSLRRLVFVPSPRRLFQRANNGRERTRARVRLSGRESLLRGQSRLFHPPLSPFPCLCERCALAGGTNRQAASTKVDSTGVTSTGIGSFPRMPRDISGLGTSREQMSL